MASGSGSKVLLIVLGVIGALGLLTVGCCVGIAMFSGNVMSDAVKDAYGDNRLVVEHIGEIEDISADFSGTGGSEGMVFNVEGSKADGQIVVYDQRGQEFGNGDLIVGGQTFELGPSGTQFRMGPDDSTSP